MHRIVIEPILLIILGILLVAISLIIPHESIRFSSLVTLLRPRRKSLTKYSVDLPKRIDLFWRCRVDLRKVPAVLNERNELVLSACPWIGSRSDAHIEIPLSSTSQLSDLKVKIVSAAFEAQVQESSPRFVLDLADEVESSFVVVPRVVGQGAVRTEIWHGDMLSGAIDSQFPVRSGQFGLLLPRWAVITLSSLGAALSLVGAAAAIVKVLFPK